MNFTVIGGGGGGGGGPTGAGGATGCAGFAATGGGGGAGAGLNRNGFRSFFAVAGRAASRASRWTSSFVASTAPLAVFGSERAGAGRCAPEGLDVGVSDPAAPISLKITAATIVSPSSASSTGFGRFEGAPDSVAMRGCPVIGCDLRNHVEPTVALGGGRDRHALEHQELRRGLQLVDEPADVVVFAGQVHRHRDLAQVSSPIALFRMESIRTRSEN